MTKEQKGYIPQRARNPRLHRVESAIAATLALITIASCAKAPESGANNTPTRVTTSDTMPTPQSINIEDIQKLHQISTDPANSSYSLWGGVSNLAEGVFVVEKNGQPIARFNSDNNIAQSDIDNIVGWNKNGDLGFFNPTELTIYNPTTNQKVIMGITSPNGHAVWKGKTLIYTSSTDHLQFTDPFPAVTADIQLPHRRYRLARM